MKKEEEGEEWEREEWSIQGGEAKCRRAHNDRKVALPKKTIGISGPRGKTGGTRRKETQKQFRSLIRIEGVKHPLTGGGRLRNPFNENFSRLKMQSGKKEKPQEILQEGREYSIEIGHWGKFLKMMVLGKRKGNQEKRECSRGRRLLLLERSPQDY